MGCEDRDFAHGMGRAHLSHSTQYRWVRQSPCPSPYQFCEVRRGDGDGGCWLAVGTVDLGPQAAEETVSDALLQAEAGFLRLSLDDMEVAIPFASPWQASEEIAGMVAGLDVNACGLEGRREVLERFPATSECVKDSLEPRRRPGRAR